MTEGSTPGWNVIITLPEATAPQARRVLRPWGMLYRTAHFHVLVMAVADPDLFLLEFGAAVAETPGLLNFIAHVFAAQRAFDFATAAEFEAKAREAALAWAPLLAGKRFHVRLHRRGLKGVVSTPNEERFLDDTLLQALSTAGTPGHIGFDAKAAMRAVQSDPLFLDEETVVIPVGSLAELEQEGHGVVLERLGLAAGDAHQRFLLEGRFDLFSVTAQIMVAAARALPLLVPGVHRLSDVPPQALWQGIANGTNDA